MKNSLGSGLQILLSCPYRLHGLPAGSTVPPWSHEIEELGGGGWPAGSVTPPFLDAASAPLSSRQKASKLHTLARKASALILPAKSQDPETGRACTIPGANKSTRRIIPTVLRAAEHITASPFLAASLILFKKSCLLQPCTLQRRKQEADQLK
jgi:hypothetical protein